MVRFPFGVHWKLISREIEWANLTVGFEQENRYAIVDVSNPLVPAGFIREESNVIVRQLLRNRRPFVATLIDGLGNELFRVRRPIWWITSSIYAEVGGKFINIPSESEWVKKDNQPPSDWPSHGNVELHDLQVTSKYANV